MVRRVYPNFARTAPRMTNNGPLTSRPAVVPADIRSLRTTTKTTIMMARYSNQSRISRFHGTGRQESPRHGEFLARGRTPSTGRAAGPGAVHLPHVRVGILTGGGDCPGLNAVIRAIVRKGEQGYGDELIGFLDAWDGVMHRRTMHLDVSSLRGMLPKGGTLLGTRRGSPYDHPDGPQQVVDTFRDMGLDGLIVIGGNGSLSVACQMYTDFALPIIGVPKTIDNDVVGTDLTFGFTTAVQIATDAIDRLHTTAESHDRVMVVEVMGRHAGWIATHAGIAGGATVILIPEMPFDIDEVCTILRQRHDRGRYASIVVVAEGAEPMAGTLPTNEKMYDQFGHVRLGGVAETIAHAIEDRTGVRGQGRHAGAHPTWRNADCIRSGAGDSLRRRGHRCRASG